MKLIKPSFQILEQKLGLEGTYEMIETAGRCCYKSTRPEGKTAKDFVDKLIKMKHLSMLEHGTVYLKIPYNGVTRDWTEFHAKYTKNPYSKLYYKEPIKDELEATFYITTNLRVLQENDWLDDLKYLCEPTEYHEKRVTVHFVTDLGVWNEFIRHRTLQRIDDTDVYLVDYDMEQRCSFAQESTRYCNYSKDKFNNELTFIIPSWMNLKEGSITTDSFGCPVKTNEETYDFLSGLGSSERAYFRLLKKGWLPQQARQVLPKALKTELVMTGFISDWMHFFGLRTSIIAETGKPHPDASNLADSLYKEFINRKYINE